MSTSLLCSTLQDISIPQPKYPSQYKWSALLGAPRLERKTLLFFRGDVGKQKGPGYSRGIRQKLYHLSTSEKWQDKYNILIGDQDDIPGDYSKGLASSRYCLVAPGGYQVMNHG